MSRSISLFRGNKLQVRVCDSGSFPRTPCQIESIKLIPPEYSPIAICEQQEFRISDSITKTLKSASESNARMSVSCANPSAEIKIHFRPDHNVNDVHLIGAGHNEEFDKLYTPNIRQR
jgi:hypothetical protein